VECYPAIDLRGGQCVRLRQGDFGEETVFGDPLELAARFLEAGAPALHVVDLDAARTGGPGNRELVLRIARLASPVPVQAGGGVRGLVEAAALLEGGVARVVMGTAAVESPEVLGAVAERWPGRVLAGLDYRRVVAEGVGPAAGVRRLVAVRGWLSDTGVEVGELAARLGEYRLAGVVATDITRDGTLEGPDVEGLALLLASSRHPVVASGGVATLADLSALAALERGGRRLAGVVVGRALLSGALSVGEAVAACAQSG
jgi:phosphoribosylformimino-5-aminoimidazole carboxamide ribotide isomerase